MFLQSHDRIVDYASVLISVIFISEILNVDSLPDGRDIIEKIQAFPWHIDTKYYTADIDICTTDSKTIGNQEFAESVQAVILYFNSKEVRKINS